jgi:hypothetical protein
MGQSVSDGALVLKTNSIERESGSPVTIAPNPFEKNFTVRWEQATELKAFKLYDARGRRIPLRVTKRGARSYHLEVNGTSSSGIHFLWVRRGEGIEAVYQLVRR